MVDGLQRNRTAGVRIAAHCRAACRGRRATHGREPAKLLVLRSGSSMRPEFLAAGPGFPKPGDGGKREVVHDWARDERAFPASSSGELRPQAHRAGAANTERPASGRRHTEELGKPAGHGAVSRTFPTLIGGIQMIEMFAGKDRTPSRAFFCTSFGDFLADLPGGGPEVTPPCRSSGIRAPHALRCFWESL